MAEPPDNQTLVFYHRLAVSLTNRFAPACPVRQVTQSFFLRRGCAAARSSATISAQDCVWDR